MNNFATIDDVRTLWRELQSSEEERCKALLTAVSARLRIEADKVGKDLDQMVSEDENLAEVAKSVTVDIVARTLMTSTDKEPMTQYSESALGYTVSGTFLTPGGGIFVKNDELKALGLKRQKIGVINLC